MDNCGERGAMAMLVRRPGVIMERKRVGKNLLKGLARVGSEFIRRKSDVLKTSLRGLEYF
jgi:hypothetical protein